MAILRFFSIFVTCWLATTNTKNFAAIELKELWRTLSHNVFALQSLRVYHNTPKR